MLPLWITKSIFGLNRNRNCTLAWIQMLPVVCVWILFAINHCISITLRTITALIMEFDFIYLCNKRIKWY